MGPSGGFRRKKAARTMRSLHPDGMGFVSPKTNALPPEDGALTLPFPGGAEGAPRIPSTSVVKMLSLLFV